MRVNNYIDSCKTFSEETDIDIDDASSVGDMLEKRWATVARLMKQIKDFQDRIKVLESTGGGIGPEDSTSGVSGIPKFVENGTLQGHMKRVNKVIFHPVYPLLASCSDDASIRVWDYEAKEHQDTFKGHVGHVSCISFNSQGTLLASGSSDQTVKVWNMISKQCQKTLQGHEHQVSSVEFTPQGEQLVSSSRDKSVKVWDLSSGYCVKTLSGHDEWVKRVVCNIYGTVVASSSKDQKIILWDIAGKGQMLNTLEGHEHVIDCIKFANAEACQVIVESDYFKTEMLNLNEEPEEETEKMGANNEQNEPQEPAPEENKKLKSTKLEELKQKKKAALEKKNTKQEEEKKEIKVREFLISGSRDKSIRIWDVKTGINIGTFQGHDNWVNELQFHPNGKYLYSCSDDKTIRVWDLKTGRNVRTINNAHNNFVTTIASKGKTLASGSADFSIKLWKGN